MNFSDTPEQAAWRTKVRTFLTEYWHGDAPTPDLMADQAAAFFSHPPDDAWQQTMRDHGWANPTWPVEFGGMGLSVMQQFIMREEFTEVGAPIPASPGAVLMMHGTEAQKREHLPRLAKGLERWCQGFSEPGAGSDLAGLSTSAVRDGDDYVVNGQKIWTSNAHEADYIWALVRTNKEAPKHRGISMLLIDMHAPGVSVRPIISMPGTHHHNEVFFQDVRVPASNLIGEEDRGWYQATAHLDVERSSIGGVVQMRKFLERSLKGLPNWRTRPGLENEVVERWIELEIAKLLSQRVVWMQETESGQTTLAASMAKLYATELKQRLVNTVMKMLGLPAILLAEGNPGRAVHGAITDLCVPSQYLNCVGATMGGGTSEIQRNVMAERGLGLPRS